MKYDLGKKPTKGAQRTLNAFSETMLKLISQKRLEDISVSEICEVSTFPRATFYNYFDDKYDLLNYCWHIIAEEIQINEETKITSHGILKVYFDRIYDIFMENKSLLDKVLVNNNSSSAMINSFINYFKEIIHHVLYNSMDQFETTLPLELLADHIVATLLLILEWIFLEQHDTTKQQAHQYIDVLLGSDLPKFKARS